MLYINGLNIKDSNNNLTIIQSCLNNKIEIPRFCYHEKLSIAGNCRMCLVEVKNSVKPIASCAMPLMQNMEIYTNSFLVKRAREGVLEFLLVNHPLDCPICDQGGECDLQDQVLIFGSDRGRFYEEKRSVLDKNIGPLIKTLMTRCIHCTRCVRFAKEIAGISILGTIGRGMRTEIGTYVENMFRSELSGNVIDLCPVGALTSKPYAFKLRSWELYKVETIDIMDSFCSNIRVDYKGDEIMRILPLLNETINEEWITDKARFSYDGLFVQRLQYPLFNDKLRGRIIKVSWSFIVKKFKEFLSKYYNTTFKFYGFTGSLVDLESTMALKLLTNKMGYCNLTNLDYIKYNKINSDLRSYYLFKYNLEDFKKIDLCFFLGTNIRYELPLLNLRLRKIYMKYKILFVSLGARYDLTYFYNQIGVSINTFMRILEGRHWFNNFFVKANEPLILFGDNVLSRLDGFNIYKSLLYIMSINKISEKNINYIPKSVSFMGNMELNGLFGRNTDFYFKDRYKKDYNILYLLNVDNVEKIYDYFNIKTTLAIYHGHNIPENKERMHMLLPSYSYIEKRSAYINFFGYIQMTKKAFFSKFDIQKDVDIINVISYVVNKKKFRIEDIYLNIKENMYFSLNVINTVGFYIEKKKSKTYKLFNYPFVSKVYNYYKTNIITYYSVNMSLCSKILNKKNISNFNK